MRGQAMVAAALVAAGCAGSPAGRTGDEGGGEGVAATLEVKIQEDTVRLLLHATNRGARALDFTFPTSQRYDFVVRDEGGAEVWRWSDGMMFLQAMSHATLAPGETWEFEAAWEPGNRMGRFEVVGTVTAAEQDVRQSATFDLP